MPIVSASQQKSDVVLSDLKSIATTTATTLESLQNFLEYGCTTSKATPVVKLTKESTKILASQNRVGSSAAKRAKPSKSEACTFKVAEDPPSKSKSIPVQEKRNLATEAFNVALKCLTQEVKLKIAARAELSNLKPAATIPPVKAKTLQPTSLNKQKAASSGCPPVVKNGDVSLVAKCATTALGLLRQLDTQTSKDDSAGRSRLEKGALILLDKIITLGLEQDAVEEASQIFNHYWNGSTGSPGSYSSKDRSVQIGQSQKSPGPMLRIAVDTPLTTNSDSTFTTTYQSQVLRLAILLGPRAITDSFLEQTRLSSGGSPANVILQSLEKGHLCVEKAGQHLRTVAQALLKLYTISSSNKLGCMGRFDLNFALLIEALTIKLESWRLSKTTPDLSRDFWCHILKSMHQITAKAGDLDAGAVDVLSQGLHNARSSLEKHNLDPRLPLDIVIAMTDMAEGAGCYALALNMLEQATSDRHSCSPAQRMLTSWRIAILKHKHHGPMGEQFLSYLAHVQKAFCEPATHNVQDLDHLLLYGARLRKIIVKVIQALTRQMKADELPVQANSTDISSCWSILSGIFTSLLKTLHLETSDQDPSKLVIRLTSFAKAFEAVFETTQNGDAHWTSLQPQADALLLQCAKAAKSLFKTESIDKINCEAFAYIKNLYAQISNIYWKRYVESSGRVDDDDNSLKYLEVSCEALLDLPSKLQQSAAYGIKLEKLALAHLSTNSYSSASQSFGAAISYYIQLGALEEATQAAMSGSWMKIWSLKGTNSYSLSKALLSATKLCLTHGIPWPNNGTWILDNHDLSAIQRSLLFEAQLPALDRHTFSAEESNVLQSHVDLMLEACCEAGLGVYRLRLLSMLFKIVSKNESLSHIGLPDPSTWTSAKTLDPNTLHAPYEESLAHLTKLQWLMYEPLNDIEPLQQHVKIYSQFLRGLRDERALQSAICDIGLVLNQIQAIVGLANMVADAEIMMDCLLAMQHICELSSAPEVCVLLDVLTQLGSLYQSLGQMSKAAEVLTRAEKHVSSGTEGIMARLRWSLTYIKYQLDVQNMMQAETAYETSLADLPNDYFSGSLSTRERLQKETVLGEYLLLASQMAHRKGYLLQANQFAKQAIKLSTRIWQATDSNANDNSTSISNGDTSLQSLIKDLSNLELSTTQGQTRHKIKGSTYWYSMNLHFQALHQMVDLSIHNGLYQDAVYYADQLKKSFASTGWTTISSRAFAISARVHAKAGHRKEAAELLQFCVTVNKRTADLENQRAMLDQAEAFVQIEEFAQASVILDILDACYKDTPNASRTEVSSETGLKKAPIRSRSRVTRPAKAPARRPGKQMTGPDVRPRTQSVSAPLNWTQQQIRDKMSTLRDWINLSTQDSPLQWAISTTATKSSSDSNTAVTTVVVALRQAFQELSSDAVNCVLAETAVALPVRYKSSRRSGRVSFIHIGHSPMGRGGRTKEAAKGALMPVANQSGGEHLMIKAQEMLYEFHQAHERANPSDTLHLASKLQSKIALLCSAMNAPFRMSSAELALQSLHSKDLVRCRELSTVISERATRERARLLNWPDISSLRTAENTHLLHECTMDSLVELPETWSIISVSLSHDGQELLLSKIVSTRSPFLLRIPLSRSDFEVDESDTFSFTDAKAELLDIVEEANTSAHDPRGQGDRDARKAWYAEREELDKRLEIWSRNIENLWFGGFRGLLSTNVFDEEHLAKYGQTLSQILDKHLPSRQKSTAVKSEKVALHAHVLELFLGLGHPDEKELDDAVTDLLYFVVDILQFSGELNAYDEIDFDAMLVDVFDALRGYHSSHSDGQSPNQHTILIVDKEMAMFPWESLPCLANSSVSRMPSLSAVMQRLERVREQSVDAQGYQIHAENGAYILNPSSDLRSTQDTFQPIFHSQLPNYNASTKKIPTESNFTELLTTKELLLYFGHGSGAQYIRGRTIRDLDSCAVTFLMGCSSAKMTECGAFESYGMPGYYISGMSGCMAVVGTLWDVTDRDIDRFAMKTMLEWGLIDEDENVTKALRKGCKKKKETNPRGNLTKKQDRRRVVSLDQAVSKGRDACLLRYLNGAAPVVYGVPVFLR